MTDPVAPGIEALGTRSVAAGQVGIAATGDRTNIDARTTHVAAGAIPRPAEVAAPPGIHNLPRRPARVFVGRDHALSRLASTLTESASAVVTQAIYGLGGVGKSELALHYAATHGADYMLIWWITAEDGAHIQAGLAALAGRLCPEIALAGTTTDGTEWAVAWLQAHHGWLLILDNVNDPGDIEELLGQLTDGHLLITTRRDAGWDQTADPIRLDVLDAGSATNLITLRTGRHDAADQKVAASIAAELATLPLALDQAAASITQTRITPAAYLQRLREHPATMYAAAAGGPAHRTISRVWDITLEEIQARHCAAVTLLHILACYAPDGVPRVLLGGGNDTTQLAVDEALGVLASYSMITLTPDTVSMHRLVQAVILNRQPPEHQSSAFCDDSQLTTALNWLNRVIPTNPDIEMACWPLLRSLVPHAEALAHRNQLGDQPDPLGVMCNHRGMFLQSQGDYERALALQQSALQIAEATLGPGHPSTAILLGNLASTYSALGRPEDALPLDERALAIAKEALGPHHPATATRLGNLAVTYSVLGRAEDALPLFEQTLATTEATLGPDHPSMATWLGSLAATYSILGRAEDALPLDERALAITEATLGPHHPATATRLGNLAATYRDLGRAEDALPLEERALAISEATPVSDHLLTATQPWNPPGSSGDVKQPADGTTMTEWSPILAGSALSTGHPTIIQLENLAILYSAHGRAADALPVEPPRRIFEMPCSEMLARVYGYLGGELSENECRAIRRHLDHCGLCLREYGLEEAVKRLVEKQVGSNSPDELRAKILVRIREVRATIDWQQEV